MNVKNSRRIENETEEIDQRFQSNPEEETGWLRAVANGDRTSFRKLHERFRVLLFSTILKVLNNHEDSEDVLQEVFAQIWRKAHLYEPSKGRALSWAATMARNRAIDHLRSIRRRARLREEFGEARVFYCPRAWQVSQHLLRLGYVEFSGE